MILNYGDIMSEKKSIFYQVKNGISVAIEEDDVFDAELLLTLSGYVAELNQLLDTKDMVFDKETMIDDLIVDVKRESVKQYIIDYLTLRTRIEFDPPTGSTLTILEKQANKMEEHIIIMGRNDR